MARNTLNKLFFLVKPLSTFFFALCCTLTASAQVQKPFDFHKLELGVSVGSTGIGLDLALPVNDYLRVRSGITYFPGFRARSSFVEELMVKEEDTEDEIARKKRMEAMMTFMSEFSDCDVDNVVDMIVQPTFVNFKLLVDVFPFRNNKHWYGTVGFYVGPSRIIKAENSTEDAATLVAAKLYNKIYKYVAYDEALPNIPISGIGNQNFDAILGSHQDMKDKMLQYGPIGVPLGLYKDGSGAAIMIPDNQGMAKVNIKTNAFRPYVGIGYKTELSKDKRFLFNLNAGALIWGGTPKMLAENMYTMSYNTEYELWTDLYKISGPDEHADEVHFDPATPTTVDLQRDVTGLVGAPRKIGDMVNLVNYFKVYPVVNFTFSYKLYKDKRK